jgi:hypothetical protein
VVPALGDVGAVARKHVLHGAQSAGRSAATHTRPPPQGPWYQA